MMPLFPSKVVAGTTVEFTVFSVKHPAPEWKMVVIIAGSSTGKFESKPLGKTHQFTIPVVQTSKFAAGRCSWSIRAMKGDIVNEVSSGTSIVSQDIDNEKVAVGFDGRTHAQRMLDAVEAVLENTATLDQESYRINNRELKRRSIQELLKLRDSYKSEIRNAALVKSGKLFDVGVKVRFGR